MNEKPIKKMSREELLELLIQYTEENEALERRAAKLERKLAAAEKMLEDRSIAIANAGSIAQAALQLNGVFEAAQRAADQYLENIRRMQPAPLDEPEIQQDMPRRRKRGTGL